jgi:NAD(P)-dependent dehydrogenase (short-subunit alcohol dehydrogenase family)
VCAVDLQRDRVHAVIETLPEGPHLAVGLDLNELGAYEGLVADAASRLGTGDAIVLAAGVSRRQPPDDVDGESWHWQLDTNLRPDFFLARATRRHMRERGTQGQHLHRDLPLRHDRWRERESGAHRLEGRHHRPDVHDGSLLRTGGHPRQQHRPGLRRHADADGGHADDRAEHTQGTTGHRGGDRRGCGLPGLGPC